MAAAAHVNASANRNGVSVFAASNSMVEIGVASSGSSAFDCFSPITAWVASAVADTIGTSNNNSENW